MRRAAWSISLLLAACASAPHGDAAPFAELFDRLHRAGRFDGVVLVADRDAVVYAGAFGAADDATATPLTTASRFDFASIGKPITAALALALARDGRLSLDDAVRTRLERFPYADVTVRQLLDHTSGMPGFEAFLTRRAEALSARTHDERAVDNDDVLAALVDAPLPADAAAGARWDYNNVNYVVLAQVLERAGSAPIDVLLRERVFTPAGMRDAFVLPTARARGTTPAALAVDYVRGDDGDWQRRADAPAFAFVARLDGTVGDGGIGGTAHDLLAFVRSFASGALVGADRRDAAWRPATLRDGTTVRNTGWQTTGYGLGWTLADDGSWVGHTGDWGGFLTGVRHYPETGCTLVYLMNRRHDDWSWLGECDARMQALVRSRSAGDPR